MWIINKKNKKKKQETRAHNERARSAHPMAFDSVISWWLWETICVYGTVIVGVILEKKLLVGMLGRKVLGGEVVCVLVCREIF